MIGLWRKLQRSIDRMILWPAMKRQANSREQAEGAFMLHMTMDPAYRGMGEWDRLALVKALP